MFHSREGGRAVAGRGSNAEGNGWWAQGVGQWAEAEVEAKAEGEVFIRQ